MKPYEKPRLMALSLGGNDQLCGSCSKGTTLYDKSGIQGMLGQTIPEADLNGNGLLDTKAEADLCFGTNDQCAEDGKHLVAGYCKFTGADPLIAWS